MQLIQTDFDGLFILENNSNSHLSKFIFKKKFFIDKQLIYDFASIKISKNPKQGTIRGLHYQIFPFQETKLISCIRGKVFDVVVDLRENSKTYLKSFQITLTEEDNLIFYVPEGFAHGYQTLEDNSQIINFISKEFSKDHFKGISYNDKNLDFQWPLDIDLRLISNEDQNWPPFNSI